MFTGDRIELFPITFGRGFKLVLRKSNKSLRFLIKLRYFD